MLARFLQNVPTNKKYNACYHTLTDTGCDAEMRFDFYSVLAPVKVNQISDLKVRSTCLFLKMSE